MHSQNVNWITTAQINLKHEKMQKSFQWRIQGRGLGGPGSPLFFDQNEARRAENNFFGYRAYLIVWMTPPPLSEGLDPLFFLFCTLFFTWFLLFSNNKKGQELKQNYDWKYLCDIRWTRVTKISRISWMRHLPCSYFVFTVKGNLFSFIARIPTVLRGRQYIPRLCLWARQTTIFSTYSCERLNFHALAK